MTTPERTTTRTTTTPPPPAPTEPVVPVQPPAPQVRAEQCARLITATSRAAQGAVQLNAIQRARRAGRTDIAKSYIDEVIDETNQAKADLRVVYHLLRLYGPDKVADAAALVVEADETVFAHAQDPDLGEHKLNMIPPGLQTAADELHAALQAFAVEARTHTR